MQSNIPIKKVLTNQDLLDTEVHVAGWVRTKRDSKGGFSFITLYDGSCFAAVQIIVEASLNNYQDILTLTTGCSLLVSGKLVKSQGSGQAVEIQACNIQIIGRVENPETYPISAKKHSVEYLREVAHLRPRTNLIGAVARVRHNLAQGIHRFFNDEGFYWLSTPILTASDTEGAGEMFRVSTLDLLNLPHLENGAVDFSEDFFGEEAYLTVSGQLNAEAYASALSKVYTFGPTFRAENSNTARHLSEFWMVEPEMAFYDLKDNISLAERFLKSVIGYILKYSEDDLDYFNSTIDKTLLARLTKFISSPFQVISYTEAINILTTQAQQKFDYPVKWGIDLQSEHERFLAEKYFNSPVVVTDYPKEFKAFYMRLNDDNTTVAAMDVLAPGIGEIIGGSQREERLYILDARIRETGMNPEHYTWYRDLRKYGTVPHSGFGLGFERLISYVTGVQNIRDTIAFPRYPKSIKF